MSEKRYPTDERGRADAGARHKPWPLCAKRIDHSNELDHELRSSVTWCTQPDQHVGPCSGPIPRALARNDFMPRRKR